MRTIDLVNPEEGREPNEEGECYAVMAGSWPITRVRQLKSDGVAKIALGQT